MNRPRDRRRDPTHPHTMMVAARERRRIAAWYERNRSIQSPDLPPHLLGPWGIDADRPFGSSGVDEPHAPMSPEEEACEEERMLADWIDMNRWGIDMEEHPEIHAEIQALAA